MPATDYAKWNSIENKIEDSDSDDELTKKNKEDLKKGLTGIIDDELRPYIKRWGLSLDLALCLACKENQADMIEQLLKEGIRFSLDVPPLPQQ